MGGHAAVDRSARDRAPDRTRGRTQKPVTDQAVTDNRAGHAADHSASNRVRAAADLMPVAGVAVIMMPVSRRRGRRNRDGRGGGYRKSCRADKFGYSSHWSNSLCFGSPTNLAIACFMRQAGNGSALLAKDAPSPLTHPPG